MYTYMDLLILSLLHTRTPSVEQRTALEVYRDLMVAFRDATEALWKDGTLEEVQIGCGPCGELRYRLQVNLKRRENNPGRTKRKQLKSSEDFDLEAPLLLSRKKRFFFSIIWQQKLMHRCVILHVSVVICLQILRNACCRTTAVLHCPLYYA